ncbi:uncharacterized protein AAEQ78_014552 isoform 1-T1 [Lycaon pictus]
MAPMDLLRPCVCKNNNNNNNNNKTNPKNKTTKCVSAKCNKAKRNKTSSCNLASSSLAMEALGLAIPHLYVPIASQEWNQEKSSYLVKPTMGWETVETPLMHKATNQINKSRGEKYF